MLLAVALLAPAPVTVNSLLREMTDLDALARVSRPAYRTAMASSYDRRSRTPGAPDWFLNEDSGHFERTEIIDGRKEYVLADLRGPGAVVRIWSANPVATLRFYFDGATKPAIEANTKKLLSGQIAPFRDPFAYVAGRGFNLYFPIPYRRSLKITVDDGEGDRAAKLFYQVGYRRYAVSTSVETYDPKRIDAKLLASVGRSLRAPQTVASSSSGERKAVAKTVEAGASLALSLDRPQSALTETQVGLALPKLPPGSPWNDPRQAHNVLRMLTFRADFDGERCIDVPLGDFFGAAPGLNPYVTMPFEVKADGTMTCRFVMPFVRTARLSIINEGAPAIPIRLAVKVAPYRVDTGTYRFHAQWKADRGSTQVKRDLRLLETSGAGRFVGASLNVFNPSTIWWGEGDERIWVDRESFPSTFGTGTEDDFGYAWGSTARFQRAYHAEPLTGGGASFMGHTSVIRTRILDAIPFDRHLAFDREIWHWTDVDASWMQTVYWYATPGSAPAGPIDQDLRLPREQTLPPSLPGVIEGEDLRVKRITGGVAEVQPLWYESGGAMLWWHDAKPKDRLTLRVPVAQPGRYRVEAAVLTHSDQAIHSIRVNGKNVDIFDGFGEWNWALRDLGVHKVSDRELLVEVEVRGRNPKVTLEDYAWALDYIRLTSVP
jgi:hypothetical protein